MPAGNRRQWLEQQVRQSFLTEVNALKPGNVSRLSAGHGMTIRDFERSAALVTPVLCDPGLTAGERILSAVSVTMTDVGCNTNLGMILLYVPLICIAEKENIKNLNELQDKLKKLIKNVDVVDSKRVFKAIQLASPGGLGTVPEYDVRSLPDIDLWSAMASAEERDFIAKQYVSGYPEIAHAAVSWIRISYQRWKSLEWAAVACYLNLLSRHADSHVMRKHGRDMAEAIKKKAIIIAGQFENYDNPAEATDLLLEFDRELKESNINPGTTADMTAASLLLYGLMNI